MNYAYWPVWLDVEVEPIPNEQWVWVRMADGGILRGWGGNGGEVFAYDENGIDSRIEAPYTHWTRRTGDDIPHPNTDLEGAVVLKNTMHPVGAEGGYGWDVTKARGFDLERVSRYIEGKVAGGWIMFAKSSLDYGGRTLYVAIMVRKAA